MHATMHDVCLSGSMVARAAQAGPSPRSAMAPVLSARRGLRRRQENGNIHSTCTLVRTRAVDVRSETRATVVDVSVDKVSMFSRALFASSEVEASPSTVWNCLTDYDKLGDFIPSLAVNRCLERFRDGCKLEQIGEQDVALGAKFRARVVLDIREHANGIPKGISSRDGQQNGRFPLPRSPLAVDGHPPMDITFDMVEGDFVRFQGVWRVQEGRDPNTCRLSYSVVVTPQVWLPVQLIEGRISGETQRNIAAVKRFAEAVQAGKARL